MADFSLPAATSAVTMGMVTRALQGNPARDLASAQAEAQAQAAQVELAQRQQQQLRQLQVDAASQRARFGATGVSSQDGSAAAVLNGLSQRTADGMAADQQALTNRLAIDAENRRQRDLLAESGGAGRLGTMVLKPLFTG